MTGTDPKILHVKRPLRHFRVARLLKTVLKTVTCRFDAPRPGLPRRRDAPPVMPRPPPQSIARADEGSELRDQGLNRGFSVSAVGFWVLGFRVSGFGFRVLGFGMGLRI